MLQDIQHVNLKELCITEDNRQKVIYFELEPDFEQELCDICKLFSSFLFRYYWTRTLGCLKGINEESYSPSAIIDLVWKPVHADLKKVMDNLVSGKISVRLVGCIFKDYAGRTTELNSELSLVIRVLGSQQKPSIWLKPTVDKIKLYFTLQDSYVKADSILKIGEMLNLQGNFNLFKEIIQQVR